MTEQSEPVKKPNGYRRSREEAERLFLDNMGLVRYVANLMAINVTEDTIQDGYIGLWKAALVFDDSRGAVFATFAVPVIRNAIRSAHRRRNRSVSADMSLHQSPFHGFGDEENTELSEMIGDRTASNAMSEAELDIYLHQALTETELTLVRMLEQGMTKTAIGKAFDHTDMWAYYHIGLIQKKLKKDFNVKG